MFNTPEWDDDDEPSNPPELTVYPDESDPDPVLYLGDGTPLYRERPPFGFTSSQRRQSQPAPKRKAKAVRRRRMR